MSSNKVTVVLVGESGVGKSTLVQFFTYKNTGETDSTESGTKEPTIYGCNVDDNRCWMDTQGTSDSDCKESDYDIMIKTLKLLQKNKTKNIKVLWLVQKVQRAKSDLQRQAKYINSLIPGNIWDSTIILTREGRTINDCAASINVASKNGASKNNYFKWDHNAFGYVLLEKLSKDDFMFELMSRLPLETRLKSGFLKNNEVKEKVLKMLGNIPSNEVCIKENEQCVKCGQKGDKRLFETNCHDEKEELHPGEKEHPGRFEQVHTGYTYYHHPGSIVDELYHSGNQRNGGRTTGRVFAGLFSLGFSEIGKWKWWSCCKKEEGSTGCCKRTKYSCCGDNSTSSGCSLKYSCCGRSSSSKGCTPRMTCCGKHPDVKWCKYSCCKTNKEFCRTQCKQCRGLWGKSPDDKCNEGENNDHHEIITV